jgi:hypothetical protein
MSGSGTVAVVVANLSSRALTLFPGLHPRP